MRHIILVALLASINVAQSQTLPDTGKASMVWQYFNTKQYEGDKWLYTEDDLYPPYVVKGQASDSMIAQYLRLLRNEIYARQGRIFKADDLQLFFNKMNWYKVAKDSLVLNGAEKKNIAFIQIKEEKWKKRNIIAIKTENQIPQPQLLNNNDETDQISPKEDEAASNISLPEGYKKSVLISGKWGKGSTEFGLDDESPRSGPTQYHITTKGIIIIEDGVFNKRIQLYDTSGNFKGSFPINFTDWNLHFSDDDFIYIIGTKEEWGLGSTALISGKMNVVVYTETGKLVNSFIVSNKLPLPGTTEPYFNVYPVDDEVVVSVGPVYPVKDSENWPKYMSVGTKQKAYSPEDQKVFNYNNKEIYKSDNKIIKSYEYNIEILKRIGFNNTWPYNDEIDNDGNIYIKRSLMGPDINEIKKYDRNGNLLAKINVPDNIGYYKGSSCPKIDRSGNIYYLQADKNWLYIIKLVKSN